MLISEGLRNYLMQLDELNLLWRRMEKRLREPRIVEIIANPDLALDTKADFAEIGRASCRERVCLAV